MEPLRRLETRAVALPLANVDTDQLIPARFMTTPRSAGYGQYLLYDTRRDEAGAVRPDFPLERPEAAGAQVMVARRNFGAGSSREAAVYALVDGGFRCVVAPSFGDIFANNAVNNGLLPARVSEDEAEAIMAALGVAGEVVLDLEACELRLGESAWRFAVDPVWRTKLLNGWDDLDLTASYTKEIETFVAKDRLARPWAQAAG